MLLLLNQSITALALPEGVEPACDEDQLASRSVELCRAGVEGDWATEERVVGR